MSQLFKSPQGPTRLNQVQITQSAQGYALAVVLGRGKIQQALLWMDDFDTKKISTGGKDKGGSQYAYSAAVIAALCNGPLTGVNDVWSNQSWLSNTAAAETWTITSGTVYTPVNAGTLQADAGVSIVSAITGTFNDLGAPSPTTLSGSDAVPLLRVPHGTTLTSGHYSIDPATNNYHFASADVGAVVTIAYHFSLGIIKEQQIDLVPVGRTISVGGTTPFHADGGVIYFTGPNAGTALVKVSGTPSTGQYSFSGRTYTFAAGDVAAEVMTTYQLNNTSALPKGVPTSLDFALFGGALSQQPWAVLRSSFPGQVLGYTGIAYVAYDPMDLGFGAQIQQNVFEVSTSDAYGGGILDCSPIQCILQVLTNTVWGLGAGAVPFPVSAIDNGAAGTWGSKAAGLTRNQDSTAWSWFAANGFFISPVIDRQDSAASLIGRWLEAGQCAAFMSEGLLKLVPYGDTSTAGNGATWIAPSAFAVALDDTCFISKENEDPVKISSSPWQDAYNVVQVQWNNRSNQYAPEITQESDEAAINRYGKRIEDPQAWDFITTLPSATFAASMRVKRGVYTRNTYEFTLPYTYSYLEPMDVCEITTSSVWAAGLNNVNLAVVNLPVRITKIVDDPQEGLKITAEDYPFGVHQPTIYNKDIASGQINPNVFADPGASEVVIFEAPNRLTGYAGNEIWIGACGTSKDWGSCNIFASLDGNTYVQLGQVDTPARLGSLAANFASGADPDTANSLVINLAENSAALDSGTTTDADQDSTLLYVGGELVSTSAIAVTGQDQYTASGYIRRGRKGSSILAHVAGELVVRLDDSIFKFTYDPSWSGLTVFFKFQSVNAFGNSAQDLSALTATSFTIPGKNPGTVDASSGLIIKASSPFVGAGPLGWAPVA